jgi:predicted aldo/keto reductase-like oxidoreductase
VERGINLLNWCGYDDGVARAVREKLAARDRVVLSMQLESRDAPSARRELDQSLRLLGTDRIEVVTFYYVESESEWQRISGPGGALEPLEAARSQGIVSVLGLTTHQRPLGARWAESGKLDLLMIRYNAAHRGAEQDVFPVTTRLKMPVLAYTAQRWGALIESTPDDPAGFTPPPAREWYRFALAHPAASAVLMAPDGREELEEDLKLLDDWRAPTPEEFALMTAHGERVRQHAGVFW